MTRRRASRPPSTKYPLPSPIDNGQRICVQLYIPDIPGHREAFLGAIYNLTNWFSWERDPLHKGREAAEVWRQIYIDMLATFYDGCEGERPCHEFSPAAAFIEYFPNNPYTQPDLITEGYNSPAWYQATALSNAVLGTQFGDIVTDISRFPPGSLPSIIPASGLPRIRVNVAGEGTVRLHMLNLLGGSIAQITIDDNPLTVRFVDLDRDQIAVPFETTTTTIEDVEIQGAGQHFIDVIIVSQVNDGIPFLHHGGGLRKIELCGFEGMVTMPNPSFRFTEDCLLQVSFNGIDYNTIPGWTEFAVACFQGAQGIQGEPGAQGAQGIQGEPGAQGEPGTPGADAPGLVCRSANAIINGLSVLVPDLMAIVKNGIDNSYTNGQIIADLDAVIGVCVDDCLTLEIALVDALMGYPGAWYVMLNLMLDTPHKNELINGLTCWLCADGAIPVETDDFTDAILGLLYTPAEAGESRDAYLVWMIWIEFLLKCKRKIVTDLQQEYFWFAPCLDCANMPAVTLTCDDWSAYFGAWEKEFLLHVQVDGWIPAASGAYKSKWVTAHGVQPFASPAGSGNFSCMEMEAEPFEARLTAVAVGLESPYEADGQIVITLRRLDTTTLTLSEMFTSGADYWSFPITENTIFDAVSVVIARQDLECTSEPVTAPAIRYVIFDGAGINPFV